MKKLIIKEEENLIRVDIYLSNTLKDLSRTQIKSMFDEGLIKVNDEFVKPSYKLKLDDVILVTFKEKEDILKPVNLNVEIVYEDDYILVVNKPKGLVVHPSKDTYEDTLVNHLLYHTNNLSRKNDYNRPGIVHRLDKDTSGLLVVAKTDEAYAGLIEQFKKRTVKRVYETLVKMPFQEDSATIEVPIIRDKEKMAVDILGKEAITHFKIINQNNDYSHIKVNLETGRTHQIRVHMSYINHPVVGDTLYGTKSKLTNKGQILCATELGFVHPITNKKMSFQIEVDEAFKEALVKAQLA